ncbi:carboxypeptidase-like regulatory domain-containing protein [Terrimonas ferruginea]|uniref:carboxypeptidase-like regulatory domain-containing protein n=1 Tax=Terrimonas ferruginea TaxID=249 RepID=UPI0009DB7624|nr:carboxypeptidase-like regulatory domain-containing protein [Terrimonas ferruginea]
MPSFVPMLVYQLSIVLVSWLSSFHGNAVPAAVVVQGKVVDARNDKPIAKVHVYVVRGEEEALTDNNGRFRVQSWQSLPLKVSATAQGFQTVSLLVKEPGKELVIRLNRE